MRWWASGRSSCFRRASRPRWRRTEPRKLRPPRPPRFPSTANPAWSSPAATPASGSTPRRSSRRAETGPWSSRAAPSPRLSRRRLPCEPSFHPSTPTTSSATRATSGTWPRSGRSPMTSPTTGPSTPSASTPASSTAETPPCTAPKTGSRKPSESTTSGTSSSPTSSSIRWNAVRS